MAGPNSARKRMSSNVRSLHRAEFDDYGCPFICAGACYDSDHLESPPTGAARVAMC